ncbi:lasso peptide biosynthesis PqqD family chaperone [Paenibacillus sp. GCM10023250]|uniref:lasso peptide biosynthesis PqqD family chaperone n=1 Tax=Paenibacillus sp. GCM10023250 TaxID=3252648 RepID=UPI00360B3799
MGKLMINENQSFCRAEGNLASNMDGDTVMMSIASGKYYNLGQIGGRIWDLIEQPLTLNKIVAILCEEYEVEDNLCAEHVRIFLAHLLEEGLVTNG